MISRVTFIGACAISAGILFTYQTRSLVWGVGGLLAGLLVGIMLSVVEERNDRNG